MSKRHTLVLALLLLGAVATPASAGSKCEASPAACQEMASRAADFCKQNPATCEKRKQRKVENKEWCDANPAECRALKDELKARRAKR